MMPVVALFLKLIAIGGSIFIVGYPIVNLLLGNKSSAEEKITLSFGAGIVFFAVMACMAASIKTAYAADQILQISTAVSLILLIANPSMRKPGEPEKGFIKALGIFFLFIATVFAIECVLPVFADGSRFGDWANHYIYSLSFFGIPCDKELVLHRTPLYNLVQFFFMSSFTKEFWQFQITGIFLNCVFLLGAYLLARELFGSRTALTALFLLSASPWFLHESWFVWPKMLTVFFLCLSLYFYLKWRKNSALSLWLFLSAFWAGISFLTHPLALFYICGIILDMALNTYREKAPAQKLKDLSKYILIVSAVILPWYFYLAYRFGPVPAFSDSVLFIEDPASRTLFGYFISRISNALFSIVSFHLILSPLAGIIPYFAGSDNVLLFVIGTFFKPSNLPVDFYFNTLSGCLTLSGFAFLSVYVITFLRRRMNEGSPANGTRLPIFSIFFIPALILDIFIVTSVAMFFIHSRSYGQIFSFYPKFMFWALLGCSIIAASVLYYVAFIFLPRKDRVSVGGSHIAVFTIIAADFVAANLAHINVAWNGILHSAMPFTALIFFIYLAECISRTNARTARFAVTAMLLESVFALWYYLFRILYTDAYVYDNNWTLKSGYGLFFIRDLIAPNSLMIILCGIIALQIICVIRALKFTDPDISV